MNDNSIEGVVERIVYENPENGFFVARLQQGNSRDLITIVGNLMAVSVGDTIRLKGQWVEDRRWGRQFRVEQYEILVPTTADAIEKYLGSGLIPGIGPKYAKRLVALFGADTLRVIDEEPKKLRRVPGIGKARLAQIQEAWQTQKAIRSVMMFLQSHGISVNQAVKIYKRYGEASVAILRENPYQLTGDIVGMGFKSADKIATQLGMPKDAPYRLQAGLLHTLKEASLDGHVFLPEKELLDEAARLLETKPELLPGQVAVLGQKQEVALESGMVYLPNLYAAENGCVQELKRLLYASSRPAPIKADKAIEWVERTQHIRLSEGQREAITQAAQSKILIITGGPGTGKTTIIKSLLEVFTKKGLKVSLAAPTGRAAKRMEAATGQDAKTIHRLLEFSPKEGHFMRNAEDALDADLVIIDETSMIDVFLMHNLLQAVRSPARIFFVGDVDQLPSVGPGMVLMDMIASGKLPVVWLKTVFRQAAMSAIVTNAHKINQGEFPTPNQQDFFLIKRKDPMEAQKTILELLVKRVPRKFQLDPRRDIQVLAPMHRGDVGVAKLNEMIQQALNPNGRPLPHRNLRVGDKVMQMRNNYELDVFNGDVGFVTAIDDEEETATVRFDERPVIYTLESLDDLALAYASTVHKSQGSEYPAVIIPLLPQHFLLLQRNVLYTAVTRGKQLVILVGDPRAIGLAIRNNRVAQRHTRLVEKLRR